MYYLFVCLFVYLSIYLFIYLFIYFSFICLQTKINKYVGQGRGNNNGGKHNAKPKKAHRHTSKKTWH